MNPTEKKISRMTYEEFQEYMEEVHRQVQAMNTEELEQYLKAPRDLIVNKNPDQNRLN